MEALNTPAVLWGLLAFAAIFGPIMILVSLRFLRRRRLIDDIPTSKSTGVFIGLVELKGTAEAEQPRTSRLAAAPCVWYQWKVEERWSRTVTESYTDSKGHRGTRTRTESGWKTVASGGEEDPFYLKDDLGVIRIRPVGAEIEPAVIFDTTCGEADPLYYSQGPASAIAHSTHTRRFYETAIPLHAAIYTIGKSRQREDIVAAEIAADKGAEIFLISTREEKKISSGYTTASWILWILGLVLSPGAMALRGRIMQAPIREILIATAIAAGGFLALWFIGWFLTVFNSIVGLRNRVRQAWANVDVELKRRADLIPNLANLAESYAKHESSTLESVAELRTRQGTGGNVLRGCAPMAKVLAEKYPDLKANGNFLSLQKSLIETEQRIALSRSYYNDIATFFNTRLQIVPDSLVAGIGMMKPAALYDAQDLERAEVKVNLAE